MININSKKHDLEGGLTVEGLLEILKEQSEFEFLVTNKYPCGVILRGYIVSSSKYDSTVVNEGDSIQVLPYLAGG